MPIFHLHLHNTHVEAMDQYGHDLADLDAARTTALDGIRGFMSHEAQDGRLDFRGRIDITDAAGIILKTISFREAFDIVGL